MSSALRQILKPIESELKEFESHFKDSMKSKVPLLDKITYYIVQRKGKQIRPVFVFLSSKAFGEINESSYIAASLVELLHTATLVHDDVVDQSNERRGFFSINALWKNKIAVIVGDYLLSKGLLLALDKEEYKSLQILSRAVKDMSEGELLQLEKARKLDIEEDIYFDIIRQKTASLIAAACAAGASSTSSNQSDVDHMWNFGEKIGIAYQIKDDLFDYGESNIGKPRGIDIKEKKMTLPLIYALNKASKSDRKQIINMIKKDSENPKVVRKVIDFVKNSGGLEYAAEKMEIYKNEALAMLDVIPDEEAKTALKELVDFVTLRAK